MTWRAFCSTCERFVYGDLESEEPCPVCSAPLLDPQAEHPVSLMPQAPKRKSVTPRTSLPNDLDPVEVDSRVNTSRALISL
jgi:hypothetical protein